MSDADLLFWCVAALKVLLSAPVQIRAARTGSTENLRIARGQRKDDWLAMVVMGTALLVDEHRFTGWAYVQLRNAIDQRLGQAPDLTSWIYAFGTVVLAWLVQRTLRRLGKLGLR